MTLQDVKNIVAFDHSQGIGRSLIGLIDAWYGKAKQAGKSEPQAVEYAFDQLAKTLNKMAERAVKP